MRILGQRRAIYQGIMELLHLWVLLSHSWHLSLPRQQFHPENLGLLGALFHLLLCFRVIVVAQDQLFVESVSLLLSFFPFSVQKKKSSRCDYFPGLVWLRTQRSLWLPPAHLMQSVVFKSELDVEVDSTQPLAKPSLWAFYF